MSELTRGEGARLGARVSRRGFLAGATAAMAAPYFVPASVLGAGGRTPPSDRIRTGHIGIGGMGSGHVGECLGNPQTQVTALCDPYYSKRDPWKQRAESRYAADLGRGTYRGCGSYADFRDVVTRDDVDAVFIASPEFWHALQSVWAMRNGKDVYCQKAMTLTVAEGWAVIDTVRRHNRVFQLGTQQRSDRNFRFAAELALNGYLGQLKIVKVAVPGGSGGLPVAQPKDPPGDLDYEMWLGPAPWTPYNDQKCSFSWYFINDYCIGWIGSWGVHHIDCALWGTPCFHAGKVEIEGTAQFPTVGQANDSYSWRVNVVAENGLRMFFTDDGGQQHGVRFEGDKGWVHVDRGSIHAEPESLLRIALKPDDIHLYESHGHTANFLECMRTRRDPVANVEAGHRATTMTIICDVATRIGRKVVWDWQAQRFVGDDVANGYLRRPMRSPWQL